jgi:hypothetical protein
VFPKNMHDADQQNCIGHHKVTAIPTVTPNLTLEELVKFMDIVVPRKHGNDLTNFTRTITEEVRSTLDTLKTDQQNTLPQQIRSWCSRFRVSHRTNNW